MKSLPWENAYFGLKVKYDQLQKSYENMEEELHNDLEGARQEAIDYKEMYDSAAAAVEVAEERSRLQFNQMDSAKEYVGKVSSKVCELVHPFTMGKKANFDTAEVLAADITRRLDPIAQAWATNRNWPWELENGEA